MNGAITSGHMPAVILINIDDISMLSNGSHNPVSELLASSAFSRQDIATYYNDTNELLININLRPFFY